MSNSVPPSDEWPPRDPEILAALQEAFAKGDWGKYHGPHGDALMAALGQLHAVEYVRLCSSGTIAVELALRGLKVGAGDEVILAGYDFPGNFRAIEAVGATPVLVDIVSATWCMDVSLVETALSPATRAIVVSHLHGGVAEMIRLREIADRNGIAIVEDACQNPGAMIQGKLAGAWGDVGVMSFGGSKLLTAGRGGAVLTSRPEVDQRMRVFSERGNDAFPLSELQAAVLLPQVRRLHERNDQRQRAVETIRAACEELPYLDVVEAVDPTHGRAAFFKVGLRYLPEGTPGHASRREFLAEMQARGIVLGEGFRGFARRSARRCRVVGTLQESEAAAEQTVVLHHPVLLGDAATIQQLLQGLASMGGK